MAALKKKPISKSTVNASPQKKSVTKAAAQSKPTKKASPKSTASAAGKPESVTKNVDALSFGQMAPAFSVMDDAGQSVSLAEFKGKWVVLYFYPKDSTPGCTTEACDFRDRMDKVKKQGAVVLGVSADSVASHARFKEKQGLNFPLLSDPDLTMCKAYGVYQQKSLYGRSFMGIVRTTFLIDPKGKIAKIYSKVKVAGHADALIEDLKAKGG